MRRFSLFDSHLDLSHSWWKNIVAPRDIVVDATCGNGHDTLALAKLSATVYTLDMQEEAIAKTQNKLKLELCVETLEHIHFYNQSHATFPEEIQQDSVTLIIYNLGYLPGGDKEITTQTKTTLASLKQALPLIRPGGAISITCYPGHPEGLREQEALLSWSSQLSPSSWSCSHTQWLNRKKSPSLLLLQKSLP